MIGMRPGCAVRSAIAAVGALALAAPAVHAAPGDPEPYVVVLHGEAREAAEATDALERSAGLRVRARYGTAVRGFATEMTDAQVARVREHASVAYVAPDTAFHGLAMARLATNETVPAGVRRIGAASTTQVHAASTTAVAVLDTGLDLASADLSVAGGVNCIKPGATPQDDNGHGTHVAGTLAGRNTGAGVVGVAPGTKLYAVKVLDAKRAGTLSSILCGLDWVAENAAALGIRVANMSVGAGGTTDADCGRSSGDALHAAVCGMTAAGVTPVAAAGNAASDLARVVPAAYPEVLTVTGMTDTDGAPGGHGPAPCSRGETDDRAWTSSNYAVAAADALHVVAAPAACIVSTKRGGGVTTMSGTSMAAPHVAGAVALCIGNGGVPGPCAALTPALVIERIRTDAAAAAATGLGFTGDLSQPLAGRTYGDLVAAGGY